MIDVGLLVSVVIVWAVVVATARFAPPAIDDPGAIDRLYLPAAGGVIIGRLVAILLDDPSSLDSIRSWLIIRSGVEFWAGVAAFTVLVCVSLRRSSIAPAGWLSEIAPHLLWAYAAYEVTCVAREGCFGPASPIGLQPDGLDTAQVPIGIVVAVAVALLGLAVRYLWGLSPVEKLALAIGGLAAIRSIAAIWLPRLGSTLTRAHRESIAVALGVAVTCAVVAVRRRRSEMTKGPQR